MANRTQPPAPTYSTPLTKSHPDFQAPWIQTILNDANTQILSEPWEVPEGGPSHDNLFNYTLIHKIGLRTRIFFSRPSADASSGTEDCIIASLGRGIDGSPGRARGGLSGLFLDQMFGVASYRSSGKGLPMATATMTVNYRNPIGTPCVILGRAWITKVEYWTKGMLEDGCGKVFAKVTALLIRPREGLL